MDKTTKDIIKNANKTGAGVTSAYDSTSKKITGRSKKNSKKAKIKMTKIIKVAYQFGKTFDKAVSSFNKTPYETITKISKSLGKELLKTTPKLKTLSKATKTAEKLSRILLLHCIRNRISIRKTLSPLSSMRQL